MTKTEAGTVVAGTFQAFRIDGTDRNLRNNLFGHVSMWYAHASEKRGEGEFGVGVLLERWRCHRQVRGTRVLCSALKIVARRALISRLPE